MTWYPSETERELYVLIDARTETTLERRQLTWEEATDLNDKLLLARENKCWFLAPPDEFLPHEPTMECSVCRRVMPASEYYSQHIDSHPCE